MEGDRGVNIRLLQENKSLVAAATSHCYQRIPSEQMSILIFATA